MFDSGVGKDGLLYWLPGAGSQLTFQVFQKIT